MSNETKYTGPWRTIPGMCADYEVNAVGDVRSWKIRGGLHRATAPTLLGGYASRGYPVVLIKDANGRRGVYRVHTLVLLAFDGPQPPNHVARHLNGNRADNRIENLRWGTPQENSDDKVTHGTMPRGASVGTAKLSEDDVAGIRALLARGHGLHWIAGLFGVSKRCVSRIRDGETWAHMRPGLAAYHAHRDAVGTTATDIEVIRG